MKLATLKALIDGEDEVWVGIPTKVSPLDGEDAYAAKTEMQGIGVAGHMHYITPLGMESSNGIAEISYFLIRSEHAPKKVGGVLPFGGLTLIGSISDEVLYAIYEKRNVVFVCRNLTDPAHESPTIPLDSSDLNKILVSISDVGHNIERLKSVLLENFPKANGGEHDCCYRVWLKVNKT